ncbi:MAG: RNA polymerase sigma factor [Bacteroidetes bacterium]|nr:RNA polymerase sigma factor [Bacteroidota bacterium]
MNNVSEEQLIILCGKGNELALKTIFEKYSKTMMGVCMRYTNDYDTAQDVLQDSFIKAFGAIRNFQAKGSFEGWLRKIVVNTALENIRKNKKKQHDITIDESFDTGIDETISASISAKVLLNVIQKIPEGYRTIFNLFAIEGYTHKEIGELLHISENTSKSQYSRAKVYIQKVLKSELIHEE